MDQAALRNADLLILTALTQTPTANPDSMLGEFCMAVGMKINNSISSSSHSRERLKQERPSNHFVSFYPVHSINAQIGWQLFSSMSC